MKDALLIVTTTAALDRTSPHFDLGDITVYSAHVVFSGSNVVGTLTLEASDTTTDADFVTVPSSSQAVTGSANHVWNVNGAGYRYVRVKWDYTSGTGNITSYLVAKENRVIGA